MGALPRLSDGALGTPQSGYWKSGIVPRKKHEDDVSPKSVITDIRFISPASSSSGSMDRPLSEAIPVKLQPTRHDRGYSISDGECSDQETSIESSRELNKVYAISGSLESLPETHSLTLKATRTNICRDGSSKGMLYKTAALLPTIEDKYQVQHKKRPYQTATSSYNTPAHDALLISSTDIHSTSGRLRLNSQSGLSSQDSSILSKCDEENRGSSTTRSPVDYPGTPVRFFPVCQTQLGSSRGNHILAGSPGIEKFVGSHSPASLAEQLGRGISFQHRFMSGPLSGGISPKPPPSKWDDAEKWIVSPSRHETASPQPQPHRSVYALPVGRRHSISGHCHRPNFGAGSPEFSASNADEKPLAPSFEKTDDRPENQPRSASNKKRAKALSFGDLSKRVFDISCPDACETSSSPSRFDGRVTHIEESSRNISQDISYETPNDGMIELDRKQESANQIPTTQLRGCGISKCLEDGSSKPPGTARCIDKPMDMEILKHALTVSMEETNSTELQASCTADPRPGQSWNFDARTSAAGSQKNSTCVTPAIAASPTRHNTPARSRRRPASPGSTLAGAGALELQTCHLAKLEFCKLGDEDRNVTTWSTRQEEDMECSVSLRDHDSGVLDREFIDDYAAAWEEPTKQTKHNGRCEKEEARIRAWEELQTSKAEAEMQKLEMKIEKMRIRAHEKLTNRIALARKKAKEMRASAHTTTPNQSTKSTQQPEHNRITGQIPSITKSPFTCCFKA